MKKIFSLVCLLFCGIALFAESSAYEDEVARAVQLAMSSPDYMITAGDVYTLAYAAGTTKVTYPILVDSSYKIRVSNLAVIDASGKTFMALKKQVEDIVTKNYPLSGVQFALTTPSSFKVIVKGEVKSTKECSAWALQRLSEIVTPNFTDYSSIRDICVTSSSGKIKYYDLFKANRDGDLNQNPYLRPGDTITVKKIDRSVTISGQVERPGTYQLLKDENIKELIDYYGSGLTHYADTSRIELVRFENGSTKSGEKIYLSQKDIDSGFVLNSYDSLYISSFSTLNPTMYIEGAISVNEGVALEASSRQIVTFNEGTNYSYLLKERAGWFRSPVCDAENAYIIRNGENIKLDLNKVLYDKDFYTDLIVQDGDVFMVPFKQYFVTVSGAVYAPGRYPYIPDRTYDYYIGLAGGVIKEKNNGKHLQIHDMNGKELKKTDFITPESSIVADANSGLYFFNQYAPVITTLLSITSTTISICAAFGVFD